MLLNDRDDVRPVATCLHPMDRILTGNENEVEKSVNVNVTIGLKERLLDQKRIDWQFAATRRS